MTFGGPGWFSAENLRKRASVIPAIEETAWRNLGELMPPGPRIEVTADFCQCPACKRERCDP